MIIDLEQGWESMQKGITKLKRIAEGADEHISADLYMTLYTTVHNMCSQHPPHNYSQQLYDKYKETFDEYISSTVLPSVRGKHDEFMLRELERRWANYKLTMVRWMSRIFLHLDRYFIPRRSLPTLNEVGLTCFRNLVYQDVKGQVRDAVIELINKEREGELIDRALLKNVLGIYVEIGMGSMEFYEVDFEKTMLDDTGAYYSRKASNWILEDSCPDYMLKAKECLERERERVSSYLHPSTEPKLLKKVQHELLVVHSKKLLEKENSGCLALLKDDKVEDLSRMYGLYHEIPQGLEPIASVFKQLITDEGMVLIKQAEDAANGQVLSELHEKCIGYVRNCFQNHSLFCEAMREAFGVLGNGKETIGL